MNRQQRCPSESSEDKRGCQHDTPNQAVAAMSMSAAAHPYQTSIRVVHNYLPKESKGWAGGDSYLPSSYHSTGISLTAMRMKEYGSLVPNNVTHQ